jgi:hypothetical protein
MDLSTTPLAPFVTIILIVCIVMMAVVFLSGSVSGATSVAKIKARW